MTYGELARADQPLRQRARASLGVGAWRARSSADRRAAPSSTSRSSAPSSTRSVVLPAVLRVRPRAGPPAARRSATAACCVTTPALYRAQDRASCATSCPSSRHVLLVGDDGDPTPGTLALDALDAAQAPADVRDRRRPTPSDMALLHFTSGTTGTPEGRRCTCTTPSSPTTPPAPSALDLHAGRHLLVHGRSRLGHRHVVRHHRAADPRRDQHRRRGRLRRRPLVRDPRSEQRVTRLVHRADGAADADAGRRRRRPASTTCPRCASSPASASRSNPEVGRLGPARPSACRSTTTGGRPRPAGS